MALPWLLPSLLLVASVGLVAAGVLAALTGRPADRFLWSAVAIAALLVGERTLAGVRAARRFRDPAALLFPVAHLARDAAWAAAITVWLTRRLAGVAALPAHSMRARAPAAGAAPAAADE